MKQLLMILTIMCCTITGWAQQNKLILNGGYVFTNVEETDAKATGWRINGLYEFNPQEGILSHGISIGYINTKSEYTSQLQTSEYTLHNLPIYYAPKVQVGNDKVKGYLKGALGIHISKYKRTGNAAEVTASDAGFYGGASLGGMFSITSNVFINVEYEWAYLSNSYYRSGFVNSVMGGIGFRFE